MAAVEDGAVYVIVVGAGEVGTYVADRLSREGHDVAVIERDRAALREVSRSGSTCSPCSGRGPTPRCCARPASTGPR